MVFGMGKLFIITLVVPVLTQPFGKDEVTV
jgi:hypothetical protein